MNTENQIIIWVSGLFMFYFSYLELRSYKENHTFKDYKSVIVSIGILGTFIGIVLGLSDFNTTDVKESIPNLLNGLKVAFITSIIGMFLSISLSAKSISKRKRSTTTEDVLNDILEQLKSLPKEKSFDNMKLLEALPEIKESLLSNNKLAETSFNTILDELKPLDELYNIKEMNKTQSDRLTSIDSNLIIQLKELERLTKIDEKLQSINDDTKAMKDSQNLQSETLVSIHDSIKLESENLQILVKMDEQLQSIHNNITVTSETTKEYIVKQLHEITEILAPLDILIAIDSNLVNVLNKSIDISKSIDENSENMQELLKDKLLNITVSLEKAVESLSKGATEEIIKALEQVITDFNSNLTNQFGENFKELNKAVFDLVNWQENYKSQVSDFETSLKNTMSNVAESNKESIILFKQEVGNTSAILSKEAEHAIDIFEKLMKSTEYIEKITKDYETISDVSQKLEEILKANNMQIQDFEAHTKSLAIIGEDARLITNEIKGFSEIITGSLSNQSDQLSKQSQSVTVMMDEIEKKLPRSLEVLNRNLTSLSEQFTENYKTLLNSLLAKNS